MFRATIPNRVGIPTSREILHFSGGNSSLSRFKKNYDQYETETNSTHCLNSTHEVIIPCGYNTLWLLSGCIIRLGVRTCEVCHQIACMSQPPRAAVGSYDSGVSILHYVGLPLVAGLHVKSFFKKKRT